MGGGGKYMKYVKPEKIALLKQKMQGKWLQYFKSDVPCLEEASRKYPNHVSCPVHGGEDGFRFFHDAPVTGGGVCNTCGAFKDGFRLLCWVNGWSFLQALFAIEVWLQNTKVSDISRMSSVYARIARNKNEISPQMVKYLQRIAEVGKRHSERVAEYFCYRGLTAPRLDNVFYISDEPYREKGKTIYLPAMVAIFKTHDGSIAGVHRTFLSPTGYGKANVTKPKMFLAAYPGALTNGSAVRLHRPKDGIVAVAEGIENAEAIFQSTGVPTWALGSAVFMPSFCPPAGIKQVDIWSDNDSSWVGQNAAFRLSFKLLMSGYQVRVMIPPDPDSDWLDVLNTEGTDFLMHTQLIAKLFTPNSPVGRIILHNLVVSVQSIREELLSLLVDKNVASSDATTLSKTTRR